MVSSEGKKTSAHICHCAVCVHNRRLNPTLDTRRNERWQKCPHCGNLQLRLVLTRIEAQEHTYTHVHTLTKKSKSPLPNPRQWHLILPSISPSSYFNSLMASPCNAMLLLNCYSVCMCVCECMTGRERERERVVYNLEYSWPSRESAAESSWRFSKSKSI